MTTRNIYVVDDDDDVRNSLRSLLGVRSNLVIRCYKTGTAFLEHLPELDPGVLLLDYHMPGLSGVDVLRGTDKMKVMTIMLTGHGSVALAMEVIRAGAVDFLEKPYEPRALLDTIDATFDKLEQDQAGVARTAAAKAKIDRLSGREKAVLEGLILGHSNKVIAHELDISPRTVEIHRANVMDKLDVRSLSDTLRICFSAGIVPLD